jgi:hypothetical protein
MLETAALYKFVNVDFLPMIFLGHIIKVRTNSRLSIWAASDFCQKRIFSAVASGTKATDSYKLSPSHYFFSVVAALFY